MENKIYDEKNGLWYELKGDYYIPCFTVPKEETQPIGIWGKRHLHFLKEHRQSTYCTILFNGKLNSYLAEIDNQAEDMFFRLMDEMAKAEGVTEELKASDQMKWIGLMNNIKSRATEIVNTELIYA